MCMYDYILIIIHALEDVDLRGRTLQGQVRITTRTGLNFWQLSEEQFDKQFDSAWKDVEEMGF